MRTREKYLTEYKTSSHLSEEIRKQTGSFWTPPEIALQMAKKTEWKEGETILDPAVGGGNLLAAMMDTYPELQEENLFGIDIDAEAINICLKLFPNGHFQVGDSLTDPITDDDFWKKPVFERWEEKKHKYFCSEEFKNKMKDVKEKMSLLKKVS